MDLKAAARRLGAANRLVIAAFVACAISLAGIARAADNIEGQVLGRGAPIAKSTVTLWAASAGAPKKLAETKTRGDVGLQCAPKAGSATPSSI